MEKFKKFIQKFLNESERDDHEPLDLRVQEVFKDETSANILYYVLRLETNKGPQTIAKYQEYLKSKNIDYTQKVQLKYGKSRTIEEILRIYGLNYGKKWSLLNNKNSLNRLIGDRMTGGYDQLYTMKDFFENYLRPWHEQKESETNPNAKIISKFWDWYKEKKAGNDNPPPVEVIDFCNNSTDEEIEQAFGKYYKFAMGLLKSYLGKDTEISEEEKLISAFWDWHRAKKAGKPKPMSEEVINGLVKFLRTNKALEVMQQYYYYAVRVIEKLSDTIIKTPVNLNGLQKELQRIMDNLDNDKYVDEIERIEKNRLNGGDMTAGPVFVLPTTVIRTIRTLAKDGSNVDKAKIGKIDKTQVKECYVYCTNELNRKFHIGRTGIFDLNIQDFYDTYKIVFTRGFNTKTLHKIFDEVCQYLLDQLDKGTAEYWKNRGKIEIDDVEDFNEAYKTLKNNGYIIMENIEDDILNHGPSRFDIARINQGKKPSWVNKITEIGPRPIKPKRSSDWTERAMDAVTGKKQPYTETEWRTDMETQKKLNQHIANKIESMLNIDYRSIDADKDDVSVYIGKNLEYRITSEGLDYLVKRINLNSVMDRKVKRCKSLKDIIKFIEDNV